MSLHRKAVRCGSSWLRIAWLVLVCAACDGSTASDAGVPAKPVVEPFRPPARPPVERDAGPAVHIDDVDAPAGDDDAGTAEVASCGDSSWECDVLDPSTCESDEACLLVAASDAAAGLAAQCAPTGELRDGDACTRSLMCGPGLDCTAFDGSGTCRRYCCELNATSGCPSGQYCRVSLLEMSDATGVALCDRCEGCSPADARACGEGRGCYVLDAGCTACLPRGNAALSEACSATNECEPGTACLRVEGEAARCVALCELEQADEDGSCDEGRSCRAAEGANLPASIGVCL